MATVLPIRGAGGGGQKSAPAPRAAQEAPNTLQSKATARIIDAISEGEIVGLVDSLESVYLNDTPLQNSDGTFNFNGVTVVTRDGTPDQTEAEGFSSVESEVNVGQELTVASGPIVKTITESNIDAVRVKIRVPQLTLQDLKTGDLNGSSVQFKIEVQPNGGSYSVVTLQNETSNPITISGKCTAPYEAAYRFQLTGSAPWNIRVTRITADSALANLQNKTYFSSFTKIIDTKLIYPDTAYIGLIIDAAVFGLDIPSRAYDIKGIQIKIPSNYNPTTRVYTGLWDGTFSIAWTDNPAWILYDMLINNRYGLGNYISEAEIDKYALYAIAQYCDELVPDGGGGMEPRFTFNGILQSRSDAYQILNSITTAFRGMMYWASGAVSVVQDKPTDPSKLVTPENVIDGNFDYSGTGLKARHTAALVTWNDPNDKYKAAIAVVEDPEGIQKYGWRQLDTTAIGCTSRGQAVRYGRWLLDTEKNETEIVTYQAALDHADVRPGMIVNIQDPSYAGVKLGGRVISGATTTSVPIDSTVTLNTGATYQLSCILPDGTLETRNITNTLPGAYSTITVSSAFSTAPAVAAMWVITSSQLAPRPFRIISIREAEKNIYEITGLFYDSTKFARVEQNLVVEAPAFSAFPTGMLIAPTTLGFSEYQYQAGPSIKSALTISWLATTDPRADSYQIFIKGPNDADYGFAGSTTGTSINILDTIEGEYDVKIRANSSLFGLRSAYLEGAYTTEGLSAPPADVTNLTISVNGDNALLSWNKVPDLDLDYYIIKYAPVLTGATWGGSQFLIPRVDKNATSKVVPSLIGTYLIKAVDVQGNESATEAFIPSTITGLLNFNAVTSVTEETAWSGTKSNTEKDGNNLQIDDLETVEDWSSIVTALTWNRDDVVATGKYTFNNAVDLGAVYTSRLTADITAFGDDTLNDVDLWTNVDLIADWDGATQSKWGVQLQIRYTQDDPAGSPTWTDWADFIVGDYTARAFQWRLLLASFQAGINAVVSNASVTVDMPDRVAGDRNLTTTAGAYTVTFSPAFKATPAIAITLNNASQGDYWTMASQSATGFQVTFKNSAGSAVARNFDWMAKGYGSVG